MSVIELFKNKDFKGLIKYYEDNNEANPLKVEVLVPKIFEKVEDYKKFLHEFCIEYSIKRVKEGLDADDLISVYVNYLDILDSLINEWFERVFELFTLYYPEASIKAQDLTSFNKIKKLNKKDIRKLYNVDEERMGLSFEKEDTQLLEESINTLNGLVKQKKSFEKRLEELVLKRAFNVGKLAGEIVAAKLISAAGGLKRLMLMPSSTIQVIGAEKALFRHLRGKRKSKPPKHGIIFHSSFVNNAPPKHRGKMARALASKISIAAKVDYFKGEPVWEKLVEDLEAKKRGLK